MNCSNFPDISGFFFFFFAYIIIIYWNVWFRRRRGEGKKMKQYRKESYHHMQIWRKQKRIEERWSLSRIILLYSIRPILLALGPFFAVSWQSICFLPIFSFSGVSYCYHIWYTKSNSFIAIDNITIDTFGVISSKAFLVTNDWLPLFDRLYRPAKYDIF